MAGPFYFAWVAASETTFGPEHVREDEQIFAMDLGHNEGEVATLSLQVRNPMAGLLAPGRKTWAWLSYDDGSTAAPVPLFFGRLISVPDDLFGQVVTLKFTAMPADFIERKRALAPSLQVRPFYDPAFLDAARRLDPDAVLEGYSALWHVDRVTHAVTISDVILGEDGLADFTENAAFYDSVRLQVDRPPLKSVVVNASVSWEQQATGLIDFGQKWFRSYSGDGLVSGWPKPYASLGAGWSAVYSDAIDVYNIANTTTLSTSTNWQNEASSHEYGDTMSLSSSRSMPILTGPYWTGLVSFSSKESHISQDPDTVDQPTASVSSSELFVPEWLIATTLVLRYEAKRTRNETVRFTLAADVQPVFTDPGGTAADFAQDSELLEVQGSVGIEGPYGDFRGDWAPGTAYHLYDYFMAGGLAYSVLRDHVSQPTFNPEQTAGQWVAGAYYAAGENVFHAGTTYAVLVTHTAAGAFDPAAVGLHHALLYEARVDQYSGSKLYQLIDGLRGNWAPGTTYLSGNIFFGPDGNYYQVAVAHVSAGTFNPYAADVAGRLLHILLLNPPPIEDVQRSAYFPTDRGQWSLEHLIARARAHLLLRSRAIRLTWECRFERAMALSCRMNARLFDPRLPGGSALGKVIAYGMKADGGTGVLIGTVTIACAVGLDTAVVPNTGDPVYVANGYVNPGYQVYEGAVLVVGAGDVGYSVPVATSIDDGLVFPLDKRQAVVSETFHTGNVDQRLKLIEAYRGAQRDEQTDAYRHAGAPEDYIKAILAAQFNSQKAQAQAYADALTSTPTWYELVLRPVVNGPFSAEYDISVTTLAVPKQIDLAG